LRYASGVESAAQPADRRLPWQSLVLAAAVIAAAAVALLLMGREPISKSGRILLWTGEVNSSENSQHIADWYSFSHVIHGIAFYALFRLASRRKWSVGACLVAAVAFESAWEIFENTPFTIERYRTATIALSYYGDSVLNSVCDILCCIGGFFLARYLPVWASIALVIAMELGVALMIRDNLTLNIIMFLYPVEWIRAWQSGA
jgi:hypothetical protein